MVSDNKMADYSKLNALGRAATKDSNDKLERLVAKEAEMNLEHYELPNLLKADYVGTWARMVEILRADTDTSNIVQRMQNWTPAQVRYAWENGGAEMNPAIIIQERLENIGNDVEH